MFLCLTYILSFNTCIYATDLNFKSIYVSFSLRLTSTRVNSKFDPLIKYVFLCLTYILCPLTFVFMQQIYIEKYLWKDTETRIVWISCKLDNSPNVALCSCKCAKHVHSVFCVLLIHNASMMLLLKKKNFYLWLKAFLKRLCCTTNMLYILCKFESSKFEFMWRDPLTDYFRLKSISTLFTDWFQSISSWSVQIRTRPEKLRGTLLSLLVFIPVHKQLCLHISVLLSLDSFQFRLPFSFTSNNVKISAFIVIRRYLWVWSIG